MKPDAYIPFYPGNFFNAVEGQEDYVIVGYLRAICHYWSHTGCKGLVDDSAFLRKICRIEKDQWESAMAIIFDNEHFFTMGEDGKWHQKRASEEWEKSLARYTAMAANGRKGGLAKERNRMKNAGE